MNAHPKVQVSVPNPVLTDVNPRLQAAAAATESSYQQWKTDLELRDELIEAAVDEGMSQRKVAAAAKVSVSRVAGILLDRGRSDLVD